MEDAQPERDGVIGLELMLEVRERFVDRVAGLRIDERHGRAVRRAVAADFSHDSRVC